LPPTDSNGAPPDSPELDKATLRELTWRLVPFLFLLYIVAYLDRINLGFAALQMQKQLGFTDSVYGLGAGIFFAGYFLFQVPSNLALMKVGARRWIAVLMVTWGIISSSMCMVTSERSFYALRFLLGAAEAGFFPGVILYLKTWFPARTRARTVARFMTAAPLSGVVGGPVSGALLGLQGKSGLAGWQWMFLVEGLPAILLGVIAWSFLVDSPADAAWLRPEQKASLEGILREENVETVQSFRISAVTAWPILVLSLVYFGLNTVSYGVSLWLPTLIKSLSGISNFEIGVLSAVPYVVAAIAMVGVGTHSDWSGERRWHTAVPAFCGAVAVSVAAHTNSVSAATALISVAVLGVFSMMGPFWAMPTALLSGTAAAVGVAVINSVGNLGGFFGPYMIGALRNATGTFKAGLLVVGAALAVSGCLVLALHKEKERGM
jgi:MFS transporter, ACS family, tartrate transporter